MSVLLSSEQREAIARAAGGAVHVTDLETGDEYVLIRADAVSLEHPAYSDEPIDIRETYGAQARVAAAAGWNDPIMDEYDDYDANLKRLRETP